MALVSVDAGAVGKGSLSGSTIAFTIRSVDHSLSIRLIAPTVRAVIEISSPPYGDSRFTTIMMWRLFNFNQKGA